MVIHTVQLEVLLSPNHYFFYLYYQYITLSYLNTPEYTLGMNMFRKGKKLPSDKMESAKDPCIKIIEVENDSSMVIDSSDFR